MAMSSRATPAVMIPHQPDSVDDALPYAELAVRHNARRLWTGQSLRLDPLQLFAHLAGRGLRLPVGTGVSLIPLRTPYDAAAQARSLALITGRTVVMGYGTATPGFVASLHGAPYRSPRTAATEFLTAARALLDGDTADLTGEYQRLRTSLTPTRPHPAVEIGAGVLRPAMARSAAAVTDVAITWLTPASYVRDVLAPALLDGAGDRCPPRVATVVHLAVDRPGRDPARLAAAVVSAHLAAPHYLDMLRRAGVNVRAEDDSLLKAKQLVEAGVFVYGSPAHIARELARHRAAGIDEVILNVGGVHFTHGLQEALTDLEDVFTAVKEHHG
ncbi:LLM class flavin-dependent oxidoreductase [Streptomyces sp. NPDC048669]|uniref:LLM class flavin-dependent oxidoreductase n=1 Tax=Streptomyces sp. NPDC048669 TaxID=3155267 RepID=UPI00344064C6